MLCEKTREYGVRGLGHTLCAKICKKGAILGIFHSLAQFIRSTKVNNPYFIVTILTQTTLTLAFIMLTLVK